MSRKSSLSYSHLRSIWIKFYMRFAVALFFGFVIWNHEPSRSYLSKLLFSAAEVVAPEDQSESFGERIGDGIDTILGNKWPIQSSLWSVFWSSFIVHLTQQPIACDLMTKKTFILSLSPIQRVHIKHALENSVSQMKQNFHTVSPRDQDLLRIMIRDQTNMQRMFSWSHSNMCNLRHH